MNVIPKVTKDAAADLQNDLKAVDVGSVGGSWGKSLGTKIVGGLAALGIGKMVGDVISQSFEQYADYEQLIGGVETLFKDSADAVQSYAADAYKTAGLSANEYMETVTSFSASLLQSLGNDTKAAADYADMAITDMSDNANKMGTSMQSIQNAYQGFAKQNYTMLDNLKLGYGGTKTEMERLIADANRLREAQGLNADLTIESYADVVEAIHTVQTEMGITGTTAKEAASTIQGSVSSMKAAWSNWLTGLADENADMEKLTDDLVNSMTTVVTNAGPILKRLIESFVRNLPDMIKGLIPVIGDLVRELPGIIIEIVPDMLAAGVELIDAIMNGITDMASELVSKMIELGGQLIQGLIDGFQARVQEFIDLMGGTIGQAHEYASMVAEVASPSKKFRRLGNYMVQGLTLGIEDEAPNAAKAMEGAIYMGGAYRATITAGSGVVGAINALHDDLGKIISEYSPNGIDATRSYLGELQRKAAMIA